MSDGYVTPTIGHIITHGGEKVDLEKGRIYSPESLERFGAYKDHVVEVEGEMYSCKVHRDAMKSVSAVEFVSVINDWRGHYNAKTLVLEEGAKCIWFHGLIVEDPVHVPSSVTELLLHPLVQIENIDEVANNEDIVVQFDSRW